MANKPTPSDPPVRVDLIFVPAKVAEQYAAALDQPTSDTQNPDPDWTHPDWTHPDWTHPGRTQEGDHE